MTFIDTHCHLNDEKFSSDFEEVLSRAESLGVTKIINFGDTLENSAQVVRLAEKFIGMYYLKNVKENILEILYK